MIVQPSIPFFWISSIDEAIPVRLKTIPIGKRINSIIEGIPIIGVNIHNGTPINKVIKTSICNFLELISKTSFHDNITIFLFFPPYFNIKITISIFYSKATIF